ncbi:AraC family transcriptional regulator [Mediterraneibacter glycyrrhizinilyticus]|uniref:helix-turn-helix transcriptional regulator n=1 Tax=Mediterraneibacter glycyrrhizinilyticus TaxID=342942 RepID=UPI00195FB9E9|nr:AraC family transcriptional regulator [Mediterraneibacter glycyrrhizinilyticus]MBM6752505.1 AraC family transcriptional regulator [Mediterraneibacter glycyrrhizinilyticus]
MEISLQNRITFFSELLTCSHNILYWCYDPELELLNADTPEAPVYDALLSINGCKEYLRSWLEGNTKPLILSDAMGLMWAAVPELSNRHTTRVHVIGPVFISDISANTLEKHLSEKGYSIKIKKTFLELLYTLPVLSVTTFFQYGQMLYYTIRGEKIAISEFHFQLPSPEHKSGQDIPVKMRSSKESHGTWAAEQELYRMVAEGNTDYQEAWDKLAVTGSYPMFSLGDPMRQSKDMALTLTSVTSRAAMWGGLTPELAYTLSDYYIQGIESASSIPEIQEILRTMFQDYVSRVHDMKENSHISRQIQDSCNYIQIHSAEKLSIADIAAQVGYAEYYFSKKFKKEMGISVKDYIKKIKVERAKIILRSETISIQEISEALSFGTQSYFTETFHKFTGMTPGEYRSKFTE